MSTLTLLINFLGSLFKSQRQLILENLALRQQVTMLRQSVKRLRATAADKLFWVLFSRCVDGWRNTLHALRGLVRSGPVPLEPSPEIHKCLSRLAYQIPETWEMDLIPEYANFLPYHA